MNKLKIYKNDHPSKDAIEWRKSHYFQHQKINGKKNCRIRTFWKSVMRLMK